MSLLHAVLFVITWIFVPLLAGLAMHQFGRLINRLLGTRREHRNNARRSRQTASAEPHRGRTFASLWRWVTIAAMAATTVLVPLSFPDESHLQRHLASVFGYRATRLSVHLTRDTPADRAAMLSALAPVLRDGGRTFTYRSGNRRGNSHSNHSVMPARYRFEGRRLDVVMGGILPNDHLVPIHATLVAATNHLPDGIGQSIPAVLAVRGRERAVKLLPRTARLHGLAWFDAARQVGRNDCRLLVDVEAPRTAVSDLMVVDASGRASQRIGLTLGSNTGANFQVKRISPMRAVSRSPDAVLLALEAVPDSFEADSESCALDFVPNIDARLVAAAALNAMPGLQGRIASVEVLPIRTFRPWLERGFEPYDDSGRGASVPAMCSYEDGEWQQANLEFARNDCARNTAAKECVAAAARRSSWASHRSRCLSQ